MEMRDSEGWTLFLRTLGKGDVARASYHERQIVARPFRK